MIKSIIFLGIVVFTSFLCKEDKNHIRKVDVNSKVTSVTNCTKRVFNEEFSNRPFGQIEFTRKELLDSIFKNVYYKECREGIKTELAHSLTFYADKDLNMYTFIKLYQKEEYVLSKAEIKSSNNPLNVKVKNEEFGVDYTKKKVAELFDLNFLKICDSLQITNRNGTANHWLYFDGGLLKKIVLHQQVN